jgi:hypothetical protein
MQLPVCIATPALVGTGVNLQTCNHDHVKTYRPTKLQSQTFAILPCCWQVIAEHLYREGRFELADEFTAEAALPGAAELRAPYIELHTVLQQVRGIMLQREERFFDSFDAAFTCIAHSAAAGEASSKLLHFQTRFYPLYRHAALKDPHTVSQQVV